MEHRIYEYQHGRTVMNIGTTKRETLQIKFGEFDASTLLDII